MSIFRIHAVRSFAALAATAIALCAIASSPAFATVTARYTYESNIANTKLGGFVSAVGDLNGDGYGDIAASASTGAYAFYGSATGPFVTAPWTSAGRGSMPAAVGDVNGDGVQDLVTFDLSTPSTAGHVYLFTGSSGGLSSTPLSTIVGPADTTGWGAATGVGDVYGDGYADVIISAPDAKNASGTGKLMLYRGSALGLSSTPVWTYVGTGDIRHVGIKVISAGDFNGDGYTDVAALCDLPSSRQGVLLFAGSSSGLSASPVWADSGSFTILKGPADFDGDGYSDFLVGSGMGGASVLYHGSASTPSVFTISSGNPQLIGDVNGDGFTDVITWTEGGICLCGLPQCKPECGVIPDRGSLIFSGPTGLLAGEASGLTLESLVAEAGDVDGDGLNEFAQGDSAYTNGQSGEGRITIYAWSGRSEALVRQLSGPAVNSGLGTALASGDMNGDGYGDLAVSTPSNSGNDAGDGRVSIFLGSATGGSSVPDFSVYGQTSFGSALASGGDINGDGYSDLVIGAPRYTNGELEEGQVSILYGGPTPDSTIDWTIESNQVYGHLGASVAIAGDVNGDGYADVLIGATGGTPGRPGNRAIATNDAHAKLYLGSSGGLGSSPAWTVDGTSATGFASAVAGAGDLNGDGYSDVAIGVPGSGQVLIFYGSSTGLPSSPALTLTGAAGFGGAIAAAGDVNGDGYGDLLVGSPTAGGGAGQADLFLGSSSGLNTTASWTLVGGAGDELGFGLAGGGDWADDGYSSILVGRPGHQSQGGYVELYRGSPSGPTSVAAYGLSSTGQLGSSLAFVDVNGDGFSEVALGAPGQPYTGNSGSMDLWRERYFGRARAPQQLRADGSAPVDMLGSSGANAFNMKARGSGAVGRSRVRLDWQVHALNGGWSALAHGPWHDSGSPGGVDHGAAPVVAEVTNLAASAPYGWRARVASSGPDFYRQSVWLSKPGRGWLQTDLRTGSTLLAAPSPPLVSGRLLSAMWPDPVVSSARLTMKLQGSHTVTIDVLDIRGRRIRRIETAGGGLNSREVSWNLRDTHGQALAPGVYFVHAVAGSQTDLRRIVVLR